MYRCFRPVFVALILCVAVPAFAQVDVELGFEPSEAAPGDEVAFFASLANHGDAAVDADLALTVTFGTFEFGPIAGQVSLAAGEELSSELSFVVPPLPATGTLTITVVATAGDFTDTATASLTLVQASASGSIVDGLQEIGQAIGDSFAQQGVVDNDTTSFGRLKSRW